MASCTTFASIVSIETYPLLQEFSHLTDRANLLSLLSPWVPPGIKLGNEGHLNDFIDGLGPAQIVGRQVLASPSMGDIQLALYNRRGVLEVEVIRAKGLLPKPGSKILPGKHFVFCWNVNIYFAWNQAWKTEVGGGGGEGEGMRILVLTENAFFVSSLIYSLRPQCNKNDQKHGGGVEDSGPILFSLFAERSFSCCRIPFVYFCRQGLVNSSIASSFFSFCNEIITQS